MTRSAGLIAYAIISTAAAFICAVGWWRATEPGDDSARDRTSRPPVVRPVPPTHRLRGATMGTGGMASSGAPTDVRASGPPTDPAAPSTPGPIAAGDRCPKCGATLAVGSKIPATAPVSVTGNGSTVIERVGGISGLPGLPQHLSALSGATIHDKLRTLLDLIRTAAPPPAENDAAGQQVYWNRIQQARTTLGQILDEAGKENGAATREALLELFRIEPDSTLTSTLGSYLSKFSQTDEQREEFARLILSLGNSPVVADRLKAVGQMSQFETPEAAAWWSRTLLNDPDEGVRAEAAGSPPYARTDESRSLLLRAAQFDPGSSVRLNAIYAIGNNPTSEELGTLLQIMRTDRHPDVPQAVLDAVAWTGSIRDTNVRDTLLEIAQDPARPKDLRSNAVSALLWGTDGGDGYIQDAGRRKELETLEQAIDDEPTPDE